MIQVTLQFATAAAAAAALRALDAEASYQADDATRTAMQTARTGSGGTGNVAKAAATETPKPTAAPAAGPAAAASPASSPKVDAEVKELDYEKDVKPLALKVSAKGREILIQAWADLGVANGKELKPEQYATAKAHFEQLLAA